eukprot:gene281-910_t
MSSKINLNRGGRLAVTGTNVAIAVMVASDATQSDQ